MQDFSHQQYYSWLATWCGFFIQMIVMLILNCVEFVSDLKLRYQACMYKRKKESNMKTLHQHYTINTRRTEKPEGILFPLFQQMDKHKERVARTMWISRSFCNFSMAQQETPAIETEMLRLYMIMFTTRWKPNYHFLCWLFMNHHFW